MIEITCNYCDKKVFTDRIFNDATIAKINELAKINDRIFCKECYENEILRPIIHKCPICGAEPIFNRPPISWEYAIKCDKASHIICITGENVKQVIDKWNNLVKRECDND